MCLLYFSRPLDDFRLGLQMQHAPVGHFMSRYLLLAAHVLRTARSFNAVAMVRHDQTEAAQRLLQKPVLSTAI